MDNGSRGDPAPSCRTKLEAIAAPAAAPGAVEANARASWRRAAVLMVFGPRDHDALGRTDAGADPTRPEELDVLLLARATTLRSHPGQVAFPGGRIDPGDAGPVAAALREAREETGLDPSSVDVLGVLPETPLDFSRHLVTPVLAWARTPSAVRVVDVAESAAVFRVGVGELLDPANRGTAVLERGGHERHGPGFVVSAGGATHIVWGFTAMLLDGLFDRLGWTSEWDAGRRILLDW